MKKLLILLVLIGVALTAGVWWWLGPRSKPTSGDIFTVQAIERGTLVDAISATGVIQPKDVALVSAELPGLVIAIDPAVDYNRKVEKNQKLIELDKGQAREKLAQANAAVEAAQADVQRADAQRFAADLVLKRQKDLVTKGGFQKDVDVAEAQLKAADASVLAAQAQVKRAQAARDEAQLGLDKTTLFAPIAGTIIDRKVLVGQTVTPLSPTPLLTLAADLKVMQVHAQITEGDVGKVRKGQKATFTVNAFPDEVFRGQVGEIRPVPTSVQGAVYYTAIVDVENVWDQQLKDWRLRPGMPAAVDIIRREHTDTWKVPIQALSYQLDPYYHSELAKAKLASLKSDPNWKQIWVVDAQKRAWPVQVRIGGATPGGDASIQDGVFAEVLEWDADLKLDPARPETWPALIIGAPPVGKGSLTDFSVRVF